MQRTARNSATWLLLAFGAGAAVQQTACVRFDAPDSFTSVDPAGRMNAAGRAAASDDESAVPQLVEMLASDDPAERLIAIAALDRITGDRLGFDPAADPAARRAGIKRWQHRVANPSGAGNDPAKVPLPQVHAQPVSTPPIDAPPTPPPKQTPPPATRTDR